ncbi:MAG: 3-deoxy-7-phosphoheptulonate synthase [Bacillota bacterium]
MIVKMKKQATLAQRDNIIKALKKRGFSIKDGSSETVFVFGIIGDTAKLDPNDLRAYDGVEHVVRVQTPFKQASRAFHEMDTVITLSNGVMIGGKDTVMIAGPCSVESETQLLTITEALHKQGVRVLRGGAFKPRTSPYTFQGLEEEGLKLLRSAADKFDMAVISEIPSADTLSLFESYVDIIQVGARNMQNFQLLKALGKSRLPVMLKRGLSATIEEWLMSAEYIISHGNPHVILCERGIRTFETYTRNTLDISAVLAVKELSHLPIIVDPSHASGRYSMIEPLSKAAIAVGADGLMIEVHNDPENALSDGAQSLKIPRFNGMSEELKKLSLMIKRPLR